jgi:hypothetical protein
MGKLALGFTPFSRRDPVSGATESLIRKDSARQSSPKLKAFQRCVREQMQGRTFSGSTSRERSMGVRKALSEAAKTCGRK